MRIIIGLLFLICIQLGFAVEGLNADGSLNKDAVQKLYFDGDFAKVVEALETYRKNNPDASNDDKVFMYKHLSVVYAANPDTRVKGESYMYQLLKIVPTASLIDMYISDNIKAIFQNVRQEFEERQRYLKGSSTQDKDEIKGKNTDTNSPSKKEPAKKKKSHAWIWWTAGGVVVAGGVAAFFLLNQAPQDTVITPDN